MEVEHSRKNYCNAERQRGFLMHAYIDENIANLHVFNFFLRYFATFLVQYIAVLEFEKYINM